MALAQAITTAKKKRIKNGPAVYHGKGWGPKLLPQMAGQKVGINRPKTDGLQGAIENRVGTKQRTPGQVSHHRKKKVLAALDRIDSGSALYGDPTKVRLMQEAHKKGWRKLKRSPEQPGLP